MRPYEEADSAILVKIHERSRLGACTRVIAQRTRFEILRLLVLMDGQVVAIRIGDDEEAATR